MIAKDAAILVMSISSLSESHCNDSFFLIRIIFDNIELYAYVDARCTHYVLCTHFCVLGLFVNDKHTHIRAE